MGGELTDDGFDDVEGNADAHGAGAGTDFDFKTDDDDDFVGGDDLDEVGVALGAGDFKLHRHQLGPGFGEVHQGSFDDAVDEAQLDGGEGSLGDEDVGVRAAEEAVDNGEDDERADFEAELAGELGCSEEVEARGAGQGVDELAVGELFGGGDTALDHGSEEGGEGCAEVSGEGLVDGVEGAHLVFADALGAFEVVDADFAWGSRGVDGGRGVARGDGGEQGVDFGLIEDVGHVSIGAMGARHARTSSAALISDRGRGVLDWVLVWIGSRETRLAVTFFCGRGCSGRRGRS